MSRGGGPGLSSAHGRLRWAVSWLTKMPQPLAGPWIAWGCWPLRRQRQWLPALPPTAGAVPLRRPCWLLMRCPLPSLPKPWWRRLLVAHGRAAGALNTLLSGQLVSRVAANAANADATRHVETLAANPSCKRLQLG